MTSVTEHESGTPAVWSELRSEVTLDLSALLWVFRKPLEVAIRRIADRTFEEDRLILERRDRLLGSYIEDYLRPGQCLMAKDAFASSYSRKRPPENSDSSARLGAET
ncbi:MAG: hypothetical protein ACI8TX_000505 [Hyphomicrobiaceae bacterium]